MSRSEAQSRSKGKLIATGPAGVEIQIVDAYYETVSRGTERLQEELPEGIYYIRWTAGSRQEDKLVRLLADEPPLEVSGGAFANPNTIVHEASRRVAPRSTAATDSDLLVLTRGDDDDSGRDTQIRLLNGAGVAMRSDTRAAREVEAEVDLGDAGVARVYHVPPGAYRLRYTASSGDTLEQTVCTFPGWRTSVALQIRRDTLLLATSDGVQPTSRRGVDARQTIMTAEPLDLSPGWDGDRTRFATILLDDLNDAVGSLSHDTIKHLLGGDTDPLTKLYAAVMIINSLEHSGWPAIEQPPPRESAERKSAEQAWLDRAGDLLAALIPFNFAPDVAICTNRLARIRRAAGATGIPIVDPPMLARTWIWLLEEHRRAKTPLPASPSFQAAILGAAETDPWFSWRSRAALGATAPSQQSSSAGAEERLSVSASAIGKALARAAGIQLNLGEPDVVRIVRALTPASQAIVSAVLKTSASDISSPGELLSAQMRAPAELIEGQARRALEELNEKIASKDITKRRDAPALLRAVKNPDDPHKGRFGGAPSLDGFTLSATFNISAKDADWVDIRLRVHAGEEAGGLGRKERVVFYLHDTFDPDRYVEKFSKNRNATLHISATGGFTVGAWIKEHNIELELDLAELKEAPAAIQQW